MNKTHQKVIGSKFMFKMSTKTTDALKRLRHCAIIVVMTEWSSSFHFTLSADILSTPSHHGSANGRPSVQEYCRCCSPSDSNLTNWLVTSLGGVSEVICQCHMHSVISLGCQCVISLTSTLCHRERDVVTRNVINLQV